MSRTELDVEGGQEGARSWVERQSPEGSGLGQGYSPQETREEINSGNF